MQQTPPTRPAIDVTEVDLGGDIVIITDADGTIVDVNDAFVHGTGFSRQEAIGATPRLLSSGLQRTSTYAELWDTVLNGRVWSGELVDRHRNGSLRTHRVTMSPILDPQGKVSHIIAVQRDLSADFSRHVGVSGVGSLHTDRTGGCVYVDDEAARLLGRATSELFGDTWRDSFFADDAIAAQEAIETALATGREQRIDARIRNDNWLHLRIVPMRAADGTDLGTSWSLEDVTDVIGLHRRLSRRDALVTALLEAHEDPVAAVDASGVIITTNVAWARMGREEHPALAHTTGDNLIERLREMGHTGDTVAANTARDLAARISGVPAVGTTESRLLVTPILSEEGGTVVRLPTGHQHTSDDPSA